MRCFRTRCSRQGRNPDTYSDILSRLEGADVVGVMHVVHLLQDGRHAGEIVTLRQRMSHMTSLCPKHLQHMLLVVFVFLLRLLLKDTTMCGADVGIINIERNADDDVVVRLRQCLTMRGEDLSMLITVRLTLRRSRSIIS